ncbi:LysE family translocator [Rhodobacteraceae bacterium CCMM004]|nr:LysE family translocator [Rhodobacteraceae bacterium CCMM004]
MPGPAMLYVAAQTVAHGARGGLRSALGVHLGGYVHVVAAALGLAVLFQTVPALYLAFKLAGAAYLCWLGLTLILGATPHPDAAVPPPAPGGLGASALVEILNPKTALFFLAFLPQFTDPSAALPLWAQLAVLGAAVNLAFSAADLAAVALAAGLTRRLRDAVRTRRLAARLGGGTLIGLGVHLATSRT